MNSIKHLIASYGFCLNAFENSILYQLVIYYSPTVFKPRLERSMDMVIKSCVLPTVMFLIDVMASEKFRSLTNIDLIHHIDIYKTIIL